MTSKLIQQGPSLLDLPVELRLQIYEYFWSIPEENKFFVSGIPNPCSLKATYLKTQLSAICTLGAICRTIRQEAYSEYFHTTQVYLGWGHLDLPAYLDRRVDYHREACLQPHDRQALELLQNSYLLQTQARHVCLRWVYIEHPPKTWLERSEYYPWELNKIEEDNANLDIAVECLARFQNITTLHVMCDDLWFGDRIWKIDCNMARRLRVIPPMVIGGLDEWNRNRDGYYDDCHAERIKSLRFSRLEKAVVGIPLTDRDGVRWFQRVNREWFWRLKGDVEGLVATGKVSTVGMLCVIDSQAVLVNANHWLCEQEGEEERSYRFKNYLGALDLHWPRVHEI